MPHAEPAPAPDAAPSPPPRSWRAHPRHLLWLLPAVALAWNVRTATAPEAPAPVPPPAEDARFGVAPDVRRAVFADIMRATPGFRDNAQRSFPKHAWTRDDHYYNLMRGHIAAVARARGLTYTQAYLIFDEGVRARWPGPRGQPHVATALPLSGARAPE